MHRILVSVFLAAAAFAQNPTDLFNRAPPDVDNALRERITEFFHYHVTGEPRKAEALVAEDTKDYFYDGNKPKYLDFKIGKIDYSDNFTKAKALVTVKMAVMLPGFNGKVMDIPSPSYWKVIDGKWYWYLEKDQQVSSPFGAMKAGPPVASGTAATMPAIPGSLNEVFAQVKLDKQTIDLKPGASDQVTISNGMVGPISLTVSGSLEGIETAFDHSEIKPGEKAVLTVKAKEGAKAGTLNVRVQQTGQSLPIQIEVK